MYLRIGDNAICLLNVFVIWMACKRLHNQYETGDFGYIILRISTDYQYSIDISLLFLQNTFTDTVDSCADTRFPYIYSTIPIIHKGVYNFPDRNALFSSIQMATTGVNTLLFIGTSDGHVLQVGDSFQLCYSVQFIQLLNFILYMDVIYLDIWCMFTLIVGVRSQQNCL